MISDKQRMLYDLPLPSKKEGRGPFRGGVIYPNELVITWYWFPTAQSKRIGTHKIKGIYYCKQAFTITSVKCWGMTFSPCWWACDAKRCFRSNAGERGFYNVAIEIGDGTMKGFTTANLPALLTVLRRQCSPDVICEEGFPWCSSVART